MKKNIFFNILKIKVSLLVFLFFMFSNASYAEKLENIYYNPWDFKTDTLVENWIITDKKNLNEFLTRDDFIWILEEVNCVKCRWDNISQEIKDKYLNKKSPFFDVSKDNPNYFCILDAKEKGITVWYDKGHIGENWTWEPWKIPFCPNNKIKLEEAIAMLFRSAKIFTINQANKVIQDMKDWKITKVLSLDVKPKLDDWSVYSFYWDIKKALNYYIEEYDENWNKKVSYMLKIWDDNKIHPKKFVSKKDFFNLAYIIFKTNSCLDWVRLGEINENANYKLWVNIGVFDSDCNPQNIESCKYSDLNPKKNTFDFYADVWWICKSWVKNPDGYRWEFYNRDTKKRELKFWKFINDYSFLEAWNYEILLRVTDNCSNMWFSKFEFYYDWNANYWDWVESPTNPNFKARIIARPISWEKPLEVIFIWESIWEWHHKYTWEIEWNKIEWREINYVFKKDWEYKVKLKVEDENWNIINDEITIKVWNSDKNVLDVDIIANPISWDSPLETNLKAKVLSKTGNFIYSWFIDWEKIINKDITYLFTKAWEHKVNLLVEDENWNTWTKEIVIKVNPPKIAQKIKVEISYPNKITQGSYGDFVWKIVPKNPTSWKYSYTWFVDWEKKWTWISKLTQYFPEPWKKTIKLKVEDEDWNIWIWEVVVYVEPKNPNDWINDFNISIKANPLSWYVPLAVRLEWIVSDFWNSWDFDYSWQIWNIFKPWRIINYSFKEIWTYKVILKIKDKIIWKEKQAFVSIRVKWKNENPENDTDWDWVVDPDDDCILIPWVKENNWCPTDSEKCNADCSCDDNTKKCNTSNIKVCSKIWLCIPKNPKWDDTDWDGVPDIDDDCVFVPWEVSNNWCPVDSWNCDSNCNCSENKHCNTSDAKECLAVWICIPNNPWNWWWDNPPWEKPKIPPKDTDWDWTPDIDDDCVFEFWPHFNNWCPTLAEKCNADCSCNPWYKCNTKDKNICSKTWICIPNNRCNADCSCNPWYRCSITPQAWSCDMSWICVKANSCLDNLTNWVWVFWNAICDTCPCAVSVESSTTIQIFDILFPAILSPDWKEIYSKWDNFIVK